MQNISENALVEMTRAINANSRAVQRLLAHLEKQASPWVDPDEAAQLLGIPHSASNNHRRKVACLAKKGFIPGFREGRPYQYWREDVLALAPRIANGDVIIPSRV